MGFLQISFSLVKQSHWLVLPVKKALSTRMMLTIAHLKNSLSTPHFLGIHKYLPLSFNRQVSGTSFLLSLSLPYPPYIPSPTAPWEHLRPLMAAMSWWPNPVLMSHLGPPPAHSYLTPLPELPPCPLLPPRLYSCCLSHLWMFRNLRLPSQSLFSPLMISLLLTFHVKEPQKAKEVISNIYYLKRNVMLLTMRTLITIRTNYMLRHRPSSACWTNHDFSSTISFYHHIGFSIWAPD